MVSQVDGVTVMMAAASEVIRNSDASTQQSARKRRPAKAEPRLCREGALMESLCALSKPILSGPERSLPARLRLRIGLTFIAALLLLERGFGPLLQPPCR